MKWKKQNRINLSPGEDEEDDDLEIQEKDSESLSEEEDEAYSSSSDPASGQKMKSMKPPMSVEPIATTSSGTIGTNGAPIFKKPIRNNENPYKA